MKSSRVRFALPLTALALLGTLAWGADVARMDTAELGKRLGSQGLAVIDVRADSDWTKSQTKVKGAVREDPNHPEAWALKYKASEAVVLYCA